MRQGCILSPLLFNLYLNDIPLRLENTQGLDPITLPNGSRLNLLLYADDLVLISTSAVGLQRSIERFHSRGQQPCKFLGTKESFYIRKEFNSHRIRLGHQHGRRFIVLGHQYGCRDVM